MDNPCRSLRTLDRDAGPLEHGGWELQARLQEMAWGDTEITVGKSQRQWKASDNAGSVGCLAFLSPGISASTAENRERPREDGHLSADTLSNRRTQLGALGTCQRQRRTSPEGPLRLPESWKEQSQALGGWRLCIALCSSHGVFTQYFLFFCSFSYRTFAAIDYSLIYIDLSTLLFNFAFLFSSSSSSSSCRVLLVAFSALFMIVLFMALSSGLF